MTADAAPDAPLTESAAPVHTRRVDGFGTVTFAPVHPDRDLDVLHGWVSQERARFWGMLDADRDRVHEIYAYLDSLATHHAYLVRHDGRPAALLQTYEPTADPIGDFYPVLPGDLGIHLLLGPPAEGAAPVPGFSAHLVSAMLGFLLADPAVLRLVAEPDARNAKAISRLTRSGFVPGPAVRLPEKPAQFVFYHRPG